MISSWEWKCDAPEYPSAKTEPSYRNSVMRQVGQVPSQKYTDVAPSPPLKWMDDASSGRPMWTLRPSPAGAPRTPSAGAWIAVGPKWTARVGPAERTVAETPASTISVEPSPTRRP